MSLTLSLVFIGVITFSLFQRIFFTEQVELDLIFGALSGYILFAIFWALLYNLVEHIFSGSFDLSKVTLVRQNSFEAFFYFSVVTQTTLGYGDIVPKTEFAKNLAAIQALLGVFYLATLVAGLVGVLAQRPKIDWRDP